MSTVIKCSSHRVVLNELICDKHLEESLSPCKRHTELLLLLLLLLLLIIITFNTSIALFQVYIKLINTNHKSGSEYKVAHALQLLFQSGPWKLLSSVTGITLLSSLLPHYLLQLLAYLSSICPPITGIKPKVLWQQKFHFNRFWVLPTCYTPSEIPATGLACV